METVQFEYTFQHIMLRHVFDVVRICSNVFVQWVRSGPVMRVCACAHHARACMPACMDVQNVCEAAVGSER